MAAVGAQRPVIRVDELARAITQAGVALEELSLALSSQEAEVLTLGPAGHLESRLQRDLPHLGLGQLAEREPEPGQRLGPKRGEHVRLVLRVVGSAGEQGT